MSNKLEKAIAIFLKANERMVIHESDLPAFKESILAGIAVLNKAHARCKPREASFWWESDPDIHLHGISFVSFHLYKSQK